VSSILEASLPIKYGDSSFTAASTVSARPSTTGSPQPTNPSSVVIFRNNHRGGILNSSNFAIFTIDIVYTFIARKDNEKMENRAGIREKNKTVIVVDFKSQFEAKRFPDRGFFNF
jgi:hypothetical protein